MVQKLTLLVLVGILGCLIVLIAQHRNTSSTEVSTVSDAQETAAPDPVADADPLSITPVEPVKNPIRTVVPVRPTTNPPRPNSPPRPVLTAALPIPEPAIATPTIFVAETPPVAPAVFAATAAVTTDSSPSLAGRAFFLGTPRSEVTIDMGDRCGQEHPGPVTTRHFLISPEGGLANVVVFVESGLENRKFQMPLEALTLDITGCLFEPYVLCLMPNQPLKIRNLDSMLHNIHATGQLNKEFNFAMAVQGQVNQRTFKTPEMFVRLKCDVHPWEFAYVSVMTNPFFAVTDKDGFFQLPGGLPAGRYTLSATHRTAGKIRKTISYRPGHSEPITFEFRQ